MYLPSDYSSNLFINPGFWIGSARILDLYGKLDKYNYSNTPNEADYNALKKDWEIIGKDLRNAIDKYESTSKD